jgi:hypothetical protein
MTCCAKISSCGCSWRSRTLEIEKPRIRSRSENGQAAHRKITQLSFRRFGNSRNVEVPPGTGTNRFVRASVTNAAVSPVTNTIRATNGDLQSLRFFLSDPGHLVKYRHNLFEGGSYLDRATTDHDYGGFPNSRPGTSLCLLSAFRFDHSTIVLTHGARQ